MLINEKPRIEIIQGDCLEVMKSIPDKSVDLVLTDPPYNISKENDNRDRSKLSSPIMRRSSPLKYNFGIWDNMDRDTFLNFTRKWLYLCIDKLKDGGTIISFFNKEDISFLGWEAKKMYDSKPHDNLGARTRTIFSWVKSNPVPSFRKVNYLSATEFVWIGSRGEKAWTFNFKMQKEMSNYMVTSNSSAYGETEHPTEKPLSLIKHFIEIHSNKDNTILDPFMGSGTTGVACKELGRNFIGIEIEPKYFEIAKRRINQATTDMFAKVR